MIYYRCSACKAELFQTEEAFMNHCRSSHCDEVIVFEQCGDSPTTKLQTKYNDMHDASEHLSKVKQEDNEAVALMSNCDVEDVLEMVNRPDFVTETVDVLNKLEMPKQAACSGITKKESTLFESVVGSREHCDKLAIATCSSNRRTTKKSYGRGVCHICGKTFASLNLHMKYKHSNVRPFICSICGYSCKQKGDLNIHVRTHTGEKPYPCDMCDKTFTTPSLRAVHRRLHSDERPFLCTTCGKSFRQNHHLINHLKCHGAKKEYKCDTCGMAFKVPGYLHSHKQIHLNNRRFVCDECGRGFIQKSNLVSHIRTHTGEKPFKCNHCGKSFSRSQALKQHNLKHCSGAAAAAGEILILQALDN